MYVCFNYGIVKGCKICEYLVISNIHFPCINISVIRLEGFFYIFVRHIESAILNYKYFFL